mmetsp:Transcript_4976/g.20294  ORF Transcript_4976/g.20294 Transcript_4976/m.20294 type:complete len:289 (+) Transcript_4976:117-983(+)
MKINSPLLLLLRSPPLHHRFWLMFAKFPSLRCTAGPSAFASCAHCSAPNICSYPCISCSRFACSVWSRTNCHDAIAFIMLTIWSPTAPCGFSCTSRTNPANACSFSWPSLSLRSAPHHGPHSSPKPLASCSGHRAANLPSAMAAFSPSDLLIIVMLSTWTKAPQSTGTYGATVSGGNASAISPADQHALLHTLMLYAWTIFGWRFAAAHSKICGSDGATCDPAPDLATSPTSAKALRRIPGEYGSLTLAIITSLSAGALAAMSASHAAPIPSATPDRRSSAATTWSGS